MQEEMDNVSREMETRKELKGNTRNLKSTVTEVSKNDFYGFISNWTQGRKNLLRPKKG